MIPENEMGVVVSFAQKIVGLSINLTSIGTSFPDAIIEIAGVSYRVEFEYQASNFVSHKHSPLECDVVVCWQNNLDDFVLPIWELSKDDWFSIPKLPTEHERQIAYWKYRALRAENAIRRIGPDVKTAMRVTTEERRKIVADLLRDDATITDAQLAKRFAVDPTTIFRDRKIIETLNGK